MSYSEGVGTLKLECPQGHPVGRILRESAHQSVQYDPGAQVGPRRFWPDDGEQTRFTVQCRFCERSVGDLTATLQAKFAELLADTAQTYGSATVPYV